METGEDHRLAGVLDKVRPIQHRVTLVQAEVEPEILEALSRDPHAHVRKVVASHAGITEEVAFRLCEDQQAAVRLALRKNPSCPPFIAAAVAATDQLGRGRGLATPEHFLEAAWQARRAKLKGKELAELAEEWLGLSPERLPEMTLEQAQLLLQVLDAKLGIGPMPSKPGGRKKSKAKKKTPAKKKAPARKKAKKKAR